MSSISKVAILLAAYNGENYLSEQLDSILSQKQVEVEVFISLDQSSDGSIDVINEYVKKHKNIKLINFELQFGSAGKNFFHLIKSVDVSGFDFVAFADQDDTWLPEKLSRAASTLIEKGYDAYSSNVLAFWENGKKKLIHKSSAQAEFDYLFESPGPGCTFLFKVALFREIQSHIINRYDDIDLLWLHDWFCYSFARFNGYAWKIDSKPTMLYRQHTNNEVGANASFTALFSRFKTVASGDGLNLVLNQAQFIGQEGLKPVVNLHSGRIGFLKLASTFYKYRRKPIDKVFCLILFLLLAVKGFKRKAY